LVPRVVWHIDIDPPIAGTSRLAGAPAMSGFRAAADKVAPELREQRDLRYTLLDDVPVAALISGHALSASGLLGETPKSGYLPVADQCAGFVIGGLLMTSFEADDPVIVTGPIAPDIDDDDPLAWHPMGTCRCTACAAAGASTFNPPRIPGTSTSTPCSVTPMCAPTAGRRSSTSTPWPSPLTQTVVSS
jgi:hypothetical protein